MEKKRYKCYAGFGSEYPVFQPMRETFEHHKKGIDAEVETADLKEALEATRGFMLPVTGINNGEASYICLVEAEEPYAARCYNAKDFSPVFMRFLF